MAGPLVGRCVVVTRAPSQAGPLVDALRRRGARPLAYPCIDIAPPRDCGPLDRLLMAAARGDADWLVLTSANAAASLRRRLDALGLAPRRLAGLAVATVGPSTAGAAERELGLGPHATPSVYVADALPDLLGPLSGARVLLPQADVAGPELASSLAAAGAQVSAVVAYRTVPGRGGPRLLGRLRRRQIDAVTLASPSSARHLVARLHEEGGGVEDLDDALLACIGPRTRAEVVRLGLAPAVVAPRSTCSALVAELEHAFADPRPSQETR